MKLEHEKALFDFDQDIDDLEQVAERYPANAANKLLKLSKAAKNETDNNTIEDPDKENKNASNTDTKRTDKEQTEKQEEPKPVFSYQVKKTERPVFATNILADLARIRAQREQE
jgi:hypothetical protein